MSLRLLPIAKISAVSAATSAREQGAHSGMDQAGRRLSGLALTGHGTTCRSANAPVLRLEDSNPSRLSGLSLSGRSSAALYLNRRLTGRMPFLSS